MPPGLLRRIADAYGGSTRLSDALGTNDQDMRHWIAGRRKCPPHVLARLPAVLAARAAERRRQAAACEAVAAELAGITG